jgi:hypothetical protein
MHARCIGDPYAVFGEGGHLNYGIYADRYMEPTLLRYFQNFSGNFSAYGTIEFVISGVFLGCVLYRS